MIILLCIAIGIVSFILGFYYAKTRFMVKEMMAMLKIATQVMNGELDGEELRTELEKLNIKE